MSEEILNCDGTDLVHKVDWSNIVGDKTLENGGFFGDLLAVTRIHLEAAKNNGELREEDAGTAYATAIMESMKNAIHFELNEGKSQVELCFLQAQADKLRCDCENDTLLTASKIELNDAQISKLTCDCENDTKRTDSSIELNDAQITKLECDCENDTTMTDSKVSLNAAQENKLACDCCNSSKIASAQSRLYERQIEGFNDNANQKLYDSQLQAWSMVFADTEMDAVTPSIVDNQICESYTRLRNRLAGAWDEEGNFIPGAGVKCEGSSYTDPDDPEKWYGIPE